VCLSIGNQASKNTGLVIGSTEGLKVGIKAIADVKFGAPDARFLEEIEAMIDHGFLEWLLQRLKGASSLREIRALSTPPEELGDPAPPQPHERITKPSIGRTPRPPDTGRSWSLLLKGADHDHLQRSLRAAAQQESG
jgi:hypothetical protein